MYETIRKTLCALVALAAGCASAISPARAGILDGLGAIGAGNVSSAPTNFPGLMQDLRGLNFGGVGLPYAYGYVGADSSSILSPGDQVDQAVTEITAGNITLALIGIGDNDNLDVADEIATGALSGAALAAHQAQVAANIATAVNTITAAGGGVVLGGFANIVHSPAAASIKADPVARANVEDALSGGNALVVDFALPQGIPFIDFFALQTAIYEAGSAQLGGVDLILDGFDSDPHYFFKDPYHAGIIIRAAIANLHIEAINQGYGTNIPLLSDLEILTLAGLEGEYVEETFAASYAYGSFVIVPEPSGLVLAGVGLAVIAMGGVRRAKRRRLSCRAYARGFGATRLDSWLLHE